MYKLVTILLLLSPGASSSFAQQQAGEFHVEQAASQEKKFDGNLKSQDDNPLVGTWRLNSDWGKGTDSHVLTLKSDFTGTIKHTKTDSMMKLQDVVVDKDELAFRFRYSEEKKVDIEFEGKLTDGKITGEFSAFGVTATVKGSQGPEDDSKEAKRSVFDIYQARTIETAGSVPMHYRLFVPPDYDAKKKYPLVLFHHGGGGAGNDNRRNLEGACVRQWIQPEFQVNHPCFIVAPQMPGKKAKDAKSSASVVALMKRRITTVHAILDSLEEEFSIDQNREYVTGLSFGGECTWLSLMAKPNRFAAAVPICAGDRLMDISNEKRGTQFAEMPLWIFHGDRDEVISVDASRKIVKALREAGGTPKFTEYLDVGHYCWDKAYGDPKLAEWLFSHSRNK